MTENRIRGVTGWAMYSYEAQEEDELSLPEDAMIFDVEFPYLEVWSGIYGGRRGLFPAICVSFQCSYCKHCKDLLPDRSTLDRLLSNDGLHLRITKQDFRSAIKQGCNLFTPFYEGVLIYVKHCPELQPFCVLDDRYPCDNEQELVIKLSVTTNPGGGPYDIRTLSIDRSTVGETGACSDYDVYVNDDDPASKYITARPFQRVNPESFDLAKIWIHDCFNSHEHCLRSEVPPLPTRVIDVGPADGSEEPKVFLSRGHKGHYTTLSYCWGGPQLFTLTQDTLGDKKQRISMSDLPLAFCDAIKVTRCLEYQYLWIDALCIVQDSDADKAVEIAKMDQVFHNASVTLCAANVASCSQSFLDTWAPRSYPEPFQLSMIKFPCPDGAVGTIFVEETNQYVVSKEPLNQRGWALQERLLSPRVLTFGLHQMYWECQSTRCCQSETVELFWHRGIERLSHDFFQRNPNDRIPAGLNHIYDRWRDIVRNYSSREFTLDMDMLPALAGIATRFASVLNDSYCAGLWRNDLLPGLAWSTTFDKPVRPSAYRAPSWSWASVDGVDYEPERQTTKNHFVMLTKVVSCDVQPLHTTAPFGEVQAGSLELRGVVRDIDWDGRRELKDVDGNSAGGIFADTTKETIDSNVSPDAEERVLSKMGHDVEEGDNAVTRRVSFIPITDVYSLMLERQPDGKYVRLGLHHFHSYEYDERVEEELEEFYKDCPERTVVII